MQTKTEKSNNNNDKGEIIKDESNLVKHAQYRSQVRWKKISMYFRPGRLVVRQQVQKGSACWPASGDCSTLICIFSIKYSQPEGPRVHPFEILVAPRWTAGARVTFYLSPAPCSPPPLLGLQHVMFRHMWWFRSVVDLLTHKATAIWWGNAESCPATSQSAERNQRSGENHQANVLFLGEGFNVPLLKTRIVV